MRSVWPLNSVSTSKLWSEIVAVTEDAKVTIPEAEYRELLGFKQASKGPQTVADPPLRGRLENDAEVAAFLTERFGRMHMDRIMEECRATFGAARSPSRTAAYRYWQKLRDKRLKET